MTTEGLRAIDDLVELIQASSRAELIKNSLRLFTWFLEKHIDGYEILIRKGKEITKVEFPQLQVLSKG